MRLVLINIMLSLFILSTSCQKSSKSAKPAPTSADLCEAGKKAELQANIDLVSQEESYGLVEACDLRVKKIDVENKLYGGNAYKSPIFTFDASDETAYLNCEVSSLDSDCKETFKALPTAERKLKCSGNLQIKCQACSDVTSDSCHCSKTWTKVVFKKSADDKYTAGSKVEGENSEGLSLAAADLTHLAPLAITGSKDNYEVAELKSFISQVDSQLLGQSHSAVQDLIQAQALIDGYMTRIASTGQKLSKSLVDSINKNKCSDPLVVGLKGMATNFMNEEPTVLGSRLQVNLDEVLGILKDEANADKKAGAGLYLASGTNGCAKTDTSDDATDGDDSSTDEGDSSVSPPSDLDDLLGDIGTDGEDTGGDETTDPTGDGSVTTPTDDATSVGTTPEGELPVDETATTAQGGNTAAKWVGGVFVGLGSVLILAGVYKLAARATGNDPSFKALPKNLKKLRAFSQVKFDANEKAFKRALKVWGDETRRFDELDKNKQLLDTPDPKTLSEEDQKKRNKLNKAEIDAEYDKSKSALDTKKTALQTELTKLKPSPSSGEVDLSKYKFSKAMETKFKTDVGPGGKFKFPATNIDPSVKAKGGGIKSGLFGIIGGITAVAVGGIVLNEVNKKKTTDTATDTATDPATDPSAGTVETGTTGPEGDEAQAIALVGKSDSVPLCISQADQFQSKMGVLGTYVLKLNELAARLESAKILWTPSH